LRELSPEASTFCHVFSQITAKSHHCGLFMLDFCRSAADSRQFLFSGLEMPCRSLQGTASLAKYRFHAFKQTTPLLAGPWIPATGLLRLESLFHPGERVSSE